MSPEKQRKRRDSSTGGEDVVDNSLVLFDDHKSPVKVVQKSPRVSRGAASPSASKLQESGRIGRKPSHGDPFIGGSSVTPTYAGSSRLRQSTAKREPASRDGSKSSSGSRPDRDSSVDLKSRGSDAFNTMDFDEKDGRKPPPPSKTAAVGGKKSTKTEKIPEAVAKAAGKGGKKVEKKSSKESDVDSEEEPPRQPASGKPTAEKAVATAKTSRKKIEADSPHGLGKKVGAAKKAAPKSPKAKGKSAKKPEPEGEEEELAGVEEDSFTAGRRGKTFHFSLFSFLIFGIFPRFLVSSTRKDWGGGVKRKVIFK